MTQTYWYHLLSLGSIQLAWRIVCRYAIYVAATQFAQTLANWLLFFHVQLKHLNYVCLLSITY